MSDNGNGGKKKRNYSPETRAKLREAAIKRHKEGKLGGAEFGRMGGRPRKERAASKVAEEARQEAERITQVFKDATDEAQPMSIRLKAAQAWIEIEREDSKLSLQEDTADAKQMSREELIAELKKKMTSGSAAAIVRQVIEQGPTIPEDDVIDIPEDDIEEDEDGDD